MNKEEIEKNLTKKINIGLLIIIFISSLFFFYEKTAEEREIKQKQQKVEQIKTDIEYQIINEYLSDK